MQGVSGSSPLGSIGFTEKFSDGQKVRSNTSEIEDY
jgi:hypothetical protein